MTPASQIPPRRLVLSQRLPPVLLLIGLALSLAFWHLAARRDAAEEAEHFQDLGRQITDLVQERLLRATDLVAGFSGLFLTGEVSRRDFHEHARALQLPGRFPGVLAVQYTPLVPGGERAEFEAAVRADTSIEPGGYPDYAIHPPGHRAYLMPVLYNEPMAGNEGAFGFDTEADPMRHRITTRARESGEASMTPPMLLPLTQNRSGFLIRQPIYRRGSQPMTVPGRRAAFQGLISGVFDAHLLFSHLLREHLQEVRIRIEDRGDADAVEPGAPMVIFDSQPGRPREAADEDRLLLEQIFPMAGRLLGVTLARPAPLAHLAPLPLAVLLGGCAASLAGFVLTRRFARHHALATQRADRLAHDAQHDALTGLPNRMLFHHRLEQAMEAARREAHCLALLYIDLNGFKQVNDRLGHEAGDTVLVGVADRLREILRPSDTPARLGGDEFVVLLTGLPAAGLWRGIADRILQQLHQPIRYGEHRLQVGVSIGAALFPQDGPDAAALLRRADAAMYRAKQDQAGLVAAGD